MQQHSAQRAPSLPACSHVPASLPPCTTRAPSLPTPVSCLPPPAAAAGEEMTLTLDMQLEESLQPKYRGLQARAACLAARLQACPAACLAEWLHGLLACPTK